MPVHIGTSGWQYASWRERFYPKGLGQGRWLGHYAARFSTVEVNNAFYRLPEATTFRRWAEHTPDSFVMAVKASRYLTHIKRLADPAEPVARFMERAQALGPKLGPVLLQLPPTLGADLGRLAAVLACFPAEVRVTVEFRHPSWFTEDTRCLLVERGTALCLADSPRRETPVWRTADWGYVRFHEGQASPHPCYGRTALDTWASRLADLWSVDDDVYAYFNNDGEACALRDAVVFARSVDRAGLRPTRVPDGREVSVRLP